jgi:hypothetical protein
MEERVKDQHLIRRELGNVVNQMIIIVSEQTKSTLMSVPTSLPFRLPKYTILIQTLSGTNTVLFQ